MLNKPSAITTFLCIIFISQGIYAQTCKDYITKTNEWNNDRYTDNENQTITDNNTKLMWKKCSEGLSDNNCATGNATYMNWQSALDLGGSLFADKSDWRLPNIKELDTLIARNCYEPSINE